MRVMPRRTNASWHHAHAGQILVEHLETGDGFELFPDQGPTVSHEQAEPAIAIMRRALLSA